MNRDTRHEKMPEIAFETVPRAEVYAATGIQFMSINTLFQLLSEVRAGDPEADFYRAKLVTAKHYFDRILPRIDAHAAAARAGAAGLMSLPAEHFAFA